MSLKIPHHAWVIVCDGRKALFLRNDGDEKFPNLRTERVEEGSHVGHAADLGSDRPGRLQKTGSPRSAVEETDYHAEAERQFAEETMRLAEDLPTEHGVILVAPPKTLATLRGRMGPALRKMVIAEIDKDLTKHPVHEIERLLTAA